MPDPWLEHAGNMAGRCQRYRKGAPTVAPLPPRDQLPREVSEGRCSYGVPGTYQVPEPDAVLPRDQWHRWDHQMLMDENGIDYGDTRCYQW